MLTLSTYFRSSAAYRVRLALAIKQLSYTPDYIHLVKQGGEHRLDRYLQKNPQGRIPLLSITHEEQTQHISQSLAIIEYLEETYPTPSLLPGDPLQRAHIRSIANMIACDIHPLNNLSTLQYFDQNFSITAEQKQLWIQHWIQSGFNAIEPQLAKHHQETKDDFSLTPTPSLVECCLIPQVYNALRFNVDMSHYPSIQRIYETVNSDKILRQASPLLQEDCDI